MIVFHCGNCGISFPAKLRIHGISYQYENGEHKMEREDDLCHICLEEADKAKLEALEKRKKNG